MNTESKRSAEIQKVNKKMERRMKEIQFQADEDAKTVVQLTESNNRLNSKIKSLRIQNEELVSTLLKDTPLIGTPFY